MSLFYSTPPPPTGLLCILQEPDSHCMTWPLLTLWPLFLQGFSVFASCQSRGLPFSEQARHALGLQPGILVLDVHMLTTLPWSQFACSIGFPSTLFNCVAYLPSFLQIHQSITLLYFFVPWDTCHLLSCYLIYLFIIFNAYWLSLSLHPYQVSTIWI